MVVASQMKVTAPCNASEANAALSDALVAEVTLGSEKAQRAFSPKFCQLERVAEWENGVSSGWSVDLP